MPDDMRTELEKHYTLRMSNEESNKLTRECLQTALIYLMSEKPFDKISVTELVRRSGVSRTAFYRNYSTKEELLSEFSESMKRLLSTAFSDKKYFSDPYGFFLELLEQVKKNSHILKLIVQSGMIAEILKSYISERKQSDKALAERYENTALYGAVLAVLLDWFDGGMTESSEDMAVLCEKIFGGMDAKP